MTKKFMLSSGIVTEKTEEYILDLFQLYLSINPGDVPYLPEFGFNFTFAGIPKSELYDKIKFRLDSFLKKIGNSFPGYNITLDGLKMVSEDLVRATIKVNQERQDVFVNIYEDS